MLLIPLMLRVLEIFGVALIGDGAAISLLVLRTSSTGYAAKLISSTVMLFDLVLFGVVVIGVEPPSACLCCARQALASRPS